jgi:protein-export membrane protein SecD
MAALGILVVGALLGFFVYQSQMGGTHAFKLGLDLSGGTQLVYRADLSGITANESEDSMAALRDTIERRVNLFGVSEPIVQTERAGAFAGDVEDRLLVELPGVTDTDEAIRLIGQTPVLEFRMLLEGADLSTMTATSSYDEFFAKASITGKELASAALEFQTGVGYANTPVVAIKFNSEGADRFEALTRENVGRIFGIFLDGTPISTPVIQEAIPGGTAIISGSFTPDEARELARNLNYGALPVPIELISTQTVSGTLGAEAIEAGVFAGLWGLALVALFMIFWYRLPGLIAVIALAIYVALMLLLFQWIPVTLTAAGIAAFILSIGMAVDANVLIFERTREELALGKTTREAIENGFARAWASIRDSNISSMITAVILFWLGTSLVKGFALVFGLGVLISMLSAITVSRTFLLAIGSENRTGIMRFLFASGLSRFSKSEARS